MVDLFENQRTAVSAVAIRTHQCDRGLLSRMTWTEPKAAQAVQSTAYIYRPIVLRTHIIMCKLTNTIGEPILIRASR